MNPFDKSTNVNALFNKKAGRKLEIKGDIFIDIPLNESVNPF